MTTTEAEQIFTDWRSYMEIHDKLSKVFMGKLPESFLPYPIDEIEEALNIVAKRRFDNGDIDGSDRVRNTIMCLMAYVDDEEALESIGGLMVGMKKSPDLRKTALSNLSRTKDSWSKIKKKQ